MKNIKIKLREVYFPFLLIAIATIIIYDLLRWFLDVKLGVLPIKEDLLNFWIPFILPWIPILIWQRRRNRILKIRGRSDNGFFLYQFIMACAITVPIIVSQKYIEKGLFTLNEVSAVNEVIKLDKEKYFKVISFSVNRDLSVPYVTSRVTGKHNEHLTYYLYMACPFKDSKSIWYGVKYQKGLSNNISDSEKESEYQHFVESSLKDFENYHFENVNYFQKEGYSDDKDGYLEAIKGENISGLKKINIKNQIILVPQKDKFEDRIDVAVPWIFISFGIGMFVILIMVLIPSIDEKELTDFRKGKPLKDDELKDMLNLINPMGENKTIAILILANILVFLILVFGGLNILSPTAKELLDVGGNRRAEIMEGEYWRLFTSMFLHSGIMHLVMNLIGLVLAGLFLEKLVGSVRLMILYVLTGLCASIASVYWHENIVSVGASGALFGLFGLIMAFVTFKVFPKDSRRAIWIFLGLYAGISLLMGFFGGADNAAHFGGLISGFILGGTLVLFDKDSLKENTVSNDE
jgi:rhomboid protease GluP